MYRLITLRHSPRGAIISGTYMHGRKLTFCLPWILHYVLSSKWRNTSWKLGSEDCAVKYQTFNLVTS